MQEERLMALCADLQLDCQQCHCRPLQLSTHGFEEGTGDLGASPIQGQQTVSGWSDPASTAKAELLVERVVAPCQSLAQARLLQPPEKNKILNFSGLSVETSIMR